jgi:O-antigen/teichoic acid export membrane protein
MASAVLLLPFYMGQLSTADFGTLSIYLTLSLLVQLLVTYSYDTSLYVHYHEFKDDAAKLASFIGSAFSLMFMIGAILFLLLATAGSWFFSWQFAEAGIHFYPNGWLAIAGGIFQAVVKVHSSLLQTREKQEPFFWSNVLLFISIVFFTISGLYLFPSSLIGPLGSRALALGLATVWVVYRIAREFGIHFNLRILGESFYFNLYTFIYQLQQWVINYFDRPLMLLYLPLASIGVYDFAIKCLIGIELFMNGLHSSFLPKVMRVVVGQKVKESLPSTNRYYNGFIAVIMLLICATILVVPIGIEWISDYLNTPAYKLSMSLIPFIAILYLVRSIRLFFGLPYTVLKYSKPLPVIYSFVAVVKIGGVMLFVDSMGMMGVIAASALSLILEVILLYLFAKNRFNFRFNAYKIVVAPIALLVVIMVSESTLLFVDENLRHLAYCILCIVLLWATYRSDLKTIKIFDLIK